MDEFVAGIYMRELVYQAEAAQIAGQDLSRALEEPDANSIARAFAAVQSLLAAAGMISKMLWPSPSGVNADGTPLSEDATIRRAATLSRGRFLRSALGIRGYPILESRKVRNALEHFDDRLDAYFAAGHRNVFDRNILPRNSIVVNGSAAQHLRLIDPQAGTISVLDDEIVIRDLRAAVVDVASRARQWIQDAEDKPLAECRGMRDV